MPTTVSEMTDEQRRAMFARLNGGSGGTSRRNPYEITNPSFGEKAGAFLSGLASGAFEGLGNIGSVLTFKPLRDKWEDDFWRNNEGRRLAEAEARAAKAERAAKKYKPTEEEKKAGKPHPMQAAAAASLYYAPPELPQRPNPVPRPKPKAGDVILSYADSDDPGAKAAETARGLEELAAQFRSERDELKARTWDRPQAPATERRNIQQARREAAAMPGATAASIIAAVEEAKAQNAQAAKWKKEVRAAMKGARTHNQIERAMEQARKDFFADYNAAMDEIGRQERARDLRVQSLDNAIMKLDLEARKATERAEAARQRQEIQKEKERLRIEAQQKRELQAWERAKERQEREYQKAVQQAQRDAVRERRQEYKAEKKDTSAYVKALHEGQIFQQEEIRPGAPHGENKEFYELMGHFYPKNWKDKGQKKDWYMALGVINDMVKADALANRKKPVRTLGDAARALAVL